MEKMADILERMGNIIPVVADDAAVYLAKKVGTPAKEGPTDPLPPKGFHFPRWFKYPRKFSPHS